MPRHEKLREGALKTGGGRKGAQRRLWRGRRNCRGRRKTRLASPKPTGRI